MKMIIAIAQDEDAAQLMDNLTKDGFRVTKLASTGGFLRAGNTTLLSGVEDDQVEKCLSIIKPVCCTRTRMVPSGVNMGMPGNMDLAYPIEVTVGGAIVFVLDVEQFIRC